jgi:hypothetical protein
MSDRGDWIQTFTGRAFYPLDPDPRDICVEDIAHALANLCRYGGHTRHFYSVAEHCILLSRYVQASPDLKHGDMSAFALWALLHDASEAYLVDLPRPVKGMLSEYRAIEGRVLSAIAVRFAMTAEIPELVKSLDRRILTDERTALMAEPPLRWATDAEPLGVIVTGLSPARAEREFLDEFHRLAWERR